MSTVRHVGERGLTMTKGDYRQSWERVLEGPKPEGPPEYTPTTQEVRNHYLALDEDRAEFDRWLAQVRADVWDEGADAGAEYEQSRLGNPPVNPYRNDKR